MYPPRLREHTYLDTEEYSFGKYADMHLKLGEAGGNAAETVRLYSEYYMNCRVP